MSSNNGGFMVPHLIKSAFTPTLLAAVSAREQYGVSLSGRTSTGFDRYAGFSIDQFYSRGCQDSIVYARWSDRAAGAWDHSTAIELSNFNLQENTLKPVLDLPRCTQLLFVMAGLNIQNSPGI
ncbi:hypothetical protein LZ023_38475 (plasmid) [Pseudomonas silvicola]|nr:hypothetical protein LZ023_38475 [Pseudomonas silvicola]